MHLAVGPGPVRVVERRRRRPATVPGQPGEIGGDVHRGPRAGGARFDRRAARRPGPVRAQLPDQLEQHLLVLGGGVGVEDDRAAGAELHPVADEDRGTDDDVQIRGAVAGQEADRPGVDAAGLGLQRVDDLQRAELGRAGHRTAGEAGADGVEGVDAGTQLSPHRGHQLVDGGVALRGHQGRHGHRTHVAHPPEVVAEQVDDHQVLGAGLGVGGERHPQPGVLGRVRAARRRALDRLGLHHAVPGDLQEALRAGAGDRELAEVQERGVRCRVESRAARGSTRTDRRGPAARRCWSGRSRSSPPPSAGAGRRRHRPRYWARSRTSQGSTSVTSPYDVPAPAGGAVRAGAGTVRRNSAVRSSQAAASVARGGGVLGQAQHVGDVLLVVDDDQPVGEQPARVRRGGPVPVDRTAFGLHLVSEIAHVPAGEVERQAGVVDPAPGRVRAGGSRRRCRRSATTAGRGGRSAPRPACTSYRTNSASGPVPSPK